MFTSFVVQCSVSVNVVKPSSKDYFPMGKAKMISVDFSTSLTINWQVVFLFYYLNLIEKNQNP